VARKEKQTFTFAFLLSKILRVPFPDTDCTYLSVAKSVEKQLKKARTDFVAAQNVISLGALDIY